MKLLEETIRELKGEDLEDDVRATVNLRVDFRIDEGFVPDMNQRLMIYRRIAAARTEDELTRIMDEVRDRYGPPPMPVLNLADYGRIRVLADALRVESIEREGSVVVFRFREKAKVDPVRLVHLVRERSDLQLIPPVSLKLDLTKPSQIGPASSAGPQAGASAAPGQGGRPQPGRALADGSDRRPKVEPAWWTARATAGEVTPGFSKAEILKPEAEDPRAPGRHPRTGDGSAGRTCGESRMPGSFSAPDVRSQQCRRGPLQGPATARVKLFVSRYLPYETPGVDRRARLLVAASAAHPRADILEQILVKVNGDIITKTELEQRQIAALRQRDPNFRPGTDADLQKALVEVTPEVIVNAVDELLLIQRGRELGYSLGNEQFRSIVENIKKENKIETEEQFQAALKQEGLTLDDLRRQIERNMLASRVQQVEVMGKIAVSDDEVKQYLRSQQGLLHDAAAGHAARDPDQRADE